MELSCDRWQDRDVVFQKRDRVDDEVVMGHSESSTAGGLNGRRDWVVMKWTCFTLIDDEVEGQLCPRDTRNGEWEEDVDGRKGGESGMEHGTEDEGSRLLYMKESQLQVLRVRSGGGRGKQTPGDEEGDD